MNILYCNRGNNDSFNIWRMHFNPSGYPVLHLYTNYLGRDLLKRSGHAYDSNKKKKKCSNTKLFKYIYSNTLQDCQQIIVDRTTWFVKKKKYPASMHITLTLCSLLLVLNILRKSGCRRNTRRMVRINCGRLHGAARDLRAACLTHAVAMESAWLDGQHVVFFVVGVNIRIITYLTRRDAEPRFDLSSIGITRKSDTVSSVRVQLDSRFCRINHVNYVNVRYVHFWYIF